MPPLLKSFQGSNGRFLKGKHWRKEKPYWSKDWCLEEYVTKGRSAQEIAVEFGVIENAIFYWLEKHGIARRSIAEARSKKYWGLKGKNNGMYGRTGKLSPTWKGGATPERQLFYISSEWKAVVRRVRKRDKGVCRRCKTTRSEGAKFCIHHVESFANKEKRALLSNLVTLCQRCHHWVHSRSNTRRRFLKGK